MKDKKLLITQNQLSDYAGSEIITLELAEHALKMGFQVTILTNYFGLPISKEFGKEITVTGSQDDVDIHQYSHVWIHHSFVPISLINALDNGKRFPVVAFHHMSPYVPLEYPFIYNFEKQVSNFVYCNSQETLDSFVERGMDKSEFTVLGNPAPDNFLTTRIGKKTHPKTILMVSNHVPEEMAQALDSLRNAGFKIVAVGESADKKRITPGDFEDVGLVISIGKTVQYAVLAGVPVYCYDHFGGPGFLTLKNFKDSQLVNFSGRNGSKKTAQQIEKEITQNLEKITLEAEEIQRKHASSLLLSKRLAEFFAKEPRTALPQVDTYSVNQAININAVLQQTYRDVVHYRELHHENHKKQLQALSEKERELASHKAELKAIKQSKVWKLRTSLRKFVS